jgi:hypothetical protein
VAVGLSGENHGGRFGIEELRAELAEQYIASRLYKDGELNHPALDERCIQLFAAEACAEVFGDYSDEGQEVFARGMRLGYLVEAMTSEKGEVALPLTETRGLFGDNSELFAEWLVSAADNQLVDHPEKVALFQRWSGAIDRGNDKLSHAHLGFFSALTLMDIAHNIDALDQAEVRRLRAEDEQYNELTRGLTRERQKELADFDRMLYRNIGAGDVARLRKVAQTVVIDTFLNTIPGIAMDMNAIDALVVYNSGPGRKKSR